MAYDRIDWHSGGKYPDDLPEEHGGIHIGMFLAWLVHQDMASNFHRTDSAGELRRLLSREITGLQFLIDACDGKLWEEDLNDQGNAFAVDYYDAKSAFARQHGSFLQDYCDVFNRHAAAHGFEYPSVYHVENTWEKFDQLKPILDQRYSQWQAWSADPVNRHGDPKAQFLHACQEVGKFLAPHGFKPNKAGTVWKKVAADKDTVFEVSFEPERYNSRSDVRMKVDLSIASKALKKWLAEKGGGAGYDGAVLFGGLLRSEKDASAMIWQVAGSTARSSIEQMCHLLAERALPLFSLFADRPRALEHLASHGGGFPAICDPSSTPLSFLLCFGTQEQAQRFFTGYFSSRPSPWRRNIIQTFTRLQAGEVWASSAYSNESDIKLAFQSGLMLPQKS
ncbi:hypothetical protein D9M09_17710 [Janthinobacterium agaricidamnosum]|uniref:DUF7832 domain-containing protein n=1 Tax=Janthinobacterium agaricidamnosum TaxID=55508 RepID=A0A3G2EEG4_9BURK|nr:MULTISPECIES: hypothetical protein [Janthinobacterium]AYM77425.1 hypothetical protein D9M09_17710 [Janthinobacterium agaricidamnosum]MCC7682247.1 hypothetical protein [Janthinobacterium sp. FW305-128]OEZ92353.1 hypothetical protein JAB8_09500 [Janthinobacterium sp. HH106]